MQAVVEQELFEPGEYLDQKGPGFFALCGKPNGRWKQEFHEVLHLPTVIELVNPALDTWITQAVFETKTRRATNMHSVGLLFADLDTYHCPGLSNKHPEDQAASLVAFCRLEGVPIPSLIMFSGRGLQAKWLLSEALGPSELVEWNTAQMALVQLLEPFAADRAARDISRVLRLDKTTNTKSGETCRLVFTEYDRNSVPQRYDFVELYETLTVHIPEKQESRQIVAGEKRIASPTALSLKRLCWYRLYDIRALWKLRGGVKE